MKFLAFLVTVVVCIKVLALPPIKNVEQSLNQGQITPVVQLGTQLVSHKIQVLRCVWSKARQGGAVATINLQTVDGAPCKIPSKAIVVKTWLDEVTDVTSSGAATMTFSTGQSAGDIKTSTGYASLSGIMNGLTDWTAASAIKMTAERTPTVAIGTTAVTAGKINVFISYIISD